MQLIRMRVITRAPYRRGTFQAMAPRAVLMVRDLQSVK